MKLALCLSISGLTMVAAIAAGSTPTAGVLPTVSGETYPLHVKFNMELEIDWSVEQGMEGRKGDPCASWSLETGHSTVTVQDAPWKRRGERRPVRHGMPGSLTFYPKGQEPDWAIGNWAGGSVVGRAKGTVRRRWNQSGGPTETQVAWDCQGSSPWQPVTTDCGGRSITTKTATVMWERRKNAPTLKDYLTAMVTPVK